MFILTLSTFVSLTLFFTCLADSRNFVYEKICKLSDSENGTCEDVHDCEYAIHLIMLHDIQHLQKLTCGFNGSTPLVCCSKNGIASPIQFNTTEPALSNTIQHIPATTTPSRPQPTIPNRPQTTIPNRPQPAISNRPQSIQPNRPQPSVPDTNTDVDYTTNHIYQEYEIQNTVTTRLPPIDLEASVNLKLLPDRSQCGIVNAAHERILGGDLAAIDEFPWIARLKYRNIRNGKIVFACAGSLISERYVLTAAHCISDVHPLMAVRLGEWDTETDRDCVQSDCNDPPVDIGVEDIVRHPNFSTSLVSRGDIALLRLMKLAKFSEFIIPICLPTTQYVVGQDYIPDMTYLTAGWGRTEHSSNSTVLQKVELKAVTMDICKVAVPDLEAAQYPYVICAGGRKGKDSCRGDSGGGLIKKVTEEHKNNWFLFGITSFGSRNCGTEGIPSIYSRVAPYMSWILQNIRP